MGYGCGIPTNGVAVNKMGLLGYRQGVFDAICAEFRQFARDLHIRNLQFIPLSALEGDNVVSKSAKTPWYQGASLLDYLDTVTIALESATGDLRFPVQYVIRPTLDFRGYAGQVSSGTVKQGETVMVLPSGRTSKVKSISTFDGDLPEAYPPMSVTVCLDDEIDITRGDMLVTPSRMPHVSRRRDAMVVWMHSHALQLDRPYLLKQTTQTVRVTVTSLLHRVDVNTLDHKKATH